MKPDNIIPLHPNKPVRADAARNRRLLLDTAQTLFDAQGIEVVTMSAIAKEANVGKGTLYRHFADKADLCHALLDEDMRDFQQMTLNHIRECDDAYDSLQWFLEHAARYVIDHNELLIEVSKQGGVDMLNHPAHIWWRQTIMGLLNRFALDIDSAYIADMLYIMLDVQTIRFQRRIQGYDITRIVDGLHMVLARLLMPIS
ncbi:MAG: helix-turn-helix domain-containing protein [Phototrophicaceae bacterium]